MADMLQRNADGYSPNYNWHKGVGAANVTISSSASNGTPAFIHGIQLDGTGANLTVAANVTLYDGAVGAGNIICELSGNQPAQYLPLCWNLRNGGSFVLASQANTTGYSVGWSGLGVNGYGNTPVGTG